MGTKKAEKPHHFIKIGDDKYRCSVGYSGVIADKKEGDGGTPLGSFRIRQIYYRPVRRGKFLDHFFSKLRYKFSFSYC
ncbi:MAG: hypothetical protein A3F12_07095 [Gammaproteobacteria bacterium RIFCSPHIGHO2_12_FULL_38_14]|nr:MAG: hypothetical protein A3F12_07095 [Gammaproteobacteria bacterium RIFCSPHIGHO2_12_FULL_38_14]